MKTLLPLLLSASLCQAQTPAPPAYQVAATWPVSGQGGWDYLSADPVGQRLYVAHGTQVEVLDLATGRLVGTIADTPGVHGVLVVPALGKGFITCGRNDAVRVFDPKTLQVTATVPTGTKPAALLYDPASGRLFVFNNGTTTATVLEAATARVVGTAELGGAPETGVSDGKGTIFVNLADRSEVVAFDAKTLAVKHRWPLAPGENPSGLALDPVHHRLFSVCANGQLLVLSAENGEKLAELPIGGGADGVVFDPGRQVALISNGSGSLTVVREESPGTFRVVQTLATARGARTISLDPRTHRAFLPAAELGPAPAAVAGGSRPRPSIVPGTFRILVVK
ncbi:YncE family protein [Hymenobacter cheonanensis]|uniref:YncE family protein n=1 Tax=Hymenobacter sp. CA2-7 TaxID=3063993 RepID=UPI0027141DCB|nr:YncE family protein [Hymenobacter sp. CA2-7]MDO7886686.1 YncE family protein [Hymenobacter sp. CA2-7]